MTVVYQAKNWKTSVTGSTAAYFITGNWRLAAGRFFTDAEERAGRAVCVIGADGAQGAVRQRRTRSAARSASSASPAR